MDTLPVTPSLPLVDEKYFNDTAASEREAMGRFVDAYAGQPTKSYLWGLLPAAGGAGLGYVVGDHIRGNPRKIMAGVGGALGGLLGFGAVRKANSNVRTADELKKMDPATLDRVSRESARQRMTEELRKKIEQMSYAQGYGLSEGNMRVDLSRRGYQMLGLMPRNEVVMQGGQMPPVALVRP